MQEKKNAPVEERGKNNMRNEVVTTLWRFIESALFLSTAILFGPAPQLAIVPASILFISKLIAILNCLRRK